MIFFINNMANYNKVLLYLHPEILSIFYQISKQNEEDKIYGPVDERSARIG